MGSSQGVDAEIVKAGIEIRDARKLRRLSQVEVAVYTDMDVATVGRIERGEVRKPEKLTILQAYFRTGPYKPKEDPVEALEMDTLRISQILRLIQRASAALSMRLGEDPTGHIDPASAQVEVVGVAEISEEFPTSTAWMSGIAPAWEPGQGQSPA